jgi:predicted nuclease of predicted toxin-antitoxin system
MRFLIDRCAGNLIAECLRNQGHDVVESRERGADPGDRVLLEWAAREARVLITIDTDFGQLVFLEGQRHCGLIRLPDVPSNERIAIIKDVVERFEKELESRSIITVRGGKIRISETP